MLAPYLFLYALRPDPHLLDELALLLVDYQPTARA
jgi:hypothetical protein